jgi:endoglucanase
MKRRIASALAALSIATASPAMAATTLPLVAATDWAAYKARFVEPSSGRVIDDANGNISHSEGQGYGLLLALFAGSRADFDLIWSFTRDELILRNDGLAAWRWDPVGSPHVSDPNNATDGDLLIAYALALAGRLWPDRDRDAEAAGMAATIVRSALVEHQGRLLILPAISGFGEKDRPDGPVANPSYWVYESFPVLDSIAPSPAWQRLREDGLALLRAAQAGPRKLPPDWVSLRTMPKPAKGFPIEFGYNALRIPLYLIRAGIADPDLLAAYRGDPGWGGAFATVDLRSGDPKDVLRDPGYRIIPALVACVLDRKPVPADLKTFAPTSYYPSTLHLLALAYLSQHPDSCP